MAKVVQVVTPAAFHRDKSWLKTVAPYSTPTDAMAVSSERRDIQRMQIGEEATQQLACSTYVEHILHVRHLARVPVADGLVEVSSILQYIQGRIVE